MRRWFKRTKRSRVKLPKSSKAKARPTVVPHINRVSVVRRVNDCDDDGGGDDGGDDGGDGGNDDNCGNCCDDDDDDIRDDNCCDGCCDELSPWGI